MTYLDELHALADETEGKVWTVVEHLDAGQITRDEAVALIAAIVAVANRRATSLASLGVAADLTLATRTPVPVPAVPVPDDVRRLNHAAATLLDRLEDTPDPEGRARRLGRSEPLKRASEARGQAIAASDLVEGWTRSLNVDTCQLCTWWHRGGRIWPKDHPMPRHTGCDCTQSVVLTERVKPVSR